MAPSRIPKSKGKISLCEENRNSLTLHPPVESMDGSSGRDSEGVRTMNLVGHESICN